MADGGAGAGSGSGSGEEEPHCWIGATPEEGRFLSSTTPHVIEGSEDEAQMVAFMEKEEKDGKINISVRHLLVHPSKPAIVLSGVLSKEECKALIGLSESYGYASLESEYPKYYRDNDRVIIRSNRIADVLWRRVQSHVPESVPSAFKDGVACGLNEQFRFCRYGPGGHFNPHMDAHYKRTYDERSCLTFMLYLNDVAEKGCTRFLGNEGDPDKVLEAVPPRAGQALVFQHTIYHDGDELPAGSKYLMRSDVMYRRPAFTDTPTSAKPAPDAAGAGGMAGGMAGGTGRSTP